MTFLKNKHVEFTVYLAPSTRPKVWPQKSCRYKNGFVLRFFWLGFVLRYGQEVGDKIDRICRVARELGLRVEPAEAYAGGQLMNRAVRVGVAKPVMIVDLASVSSLDETTRERLADRMFRTGHPDDYGDRS